MFKLKQQTMDGKVCLNCGNTAKIRISLRIYPRRAWPGFNAFACSMVPCYWRILADWQAIGPVLKETSDEQA